MKCAEDCHNIVLHGRHLTFFAILVGIPFFFQFAFWNKWFDADWIFTILVFFGLLTHVIGIMGETAFSMRIPIKMDEKKKDVSLKWLEEYREQQIERLFGRTKHSDYADGWDAGYDAALRDCFLDAKKEAKKRTVLGEAKKIIEKNLLALKKMGKEAKK